jgi:hypothetical protein
LSDECCGKKKREKASQHMMPALKAAKTGIMCNTLFPAFVSGYNPDGV